MQIIEIGEQINNKTKQEQKVIKSLVLEDKLKELEQRINKFQKNYFAKSLGSP